MQFYSIQVRAPSFGEASRPSLLLARDVNSFDSFAVRESCLLGVGSLSVFASL